MCIHTLLIMLNGFVTCFPNLVLLTIATLPHSQTLLSFFWNCRNVMVHQKFLFLNIKQHMFYLFLFTGSSLIQSTVESISKLIMLSFISVINQHIFCMVKDAKQPWHHLRFPFQKFSVARVMLTGSQLTQSLPNIMMNTVNA